MFLIGGLLPFLLYSQTANQEKLLCENCNHLFSPNRMAAKDWVIAITLFILACCFVAYLFYYHYTRS